MVTACMQYAADTENKNKAKASKAQGEAKKIASEYEEKIKTVILGEQRDMYVPIRSLLHNKTSFPLLVGKY